MNPNDQERIGALLRQALPPVNNSAEPERDLWPAMLRCLDRKPARVPWFDWALLAGLAGMTAAFPAALPVILYYL